MPDTRNTKPNQTESLKKNFADQQVEYPYIDHTHNRQLTRTHGAIKNSIR